MEREIYIGVFSNFDGIACATIFLYMHCRYHSMYIYIYNSWNGKYMYQRTEIRVNPNLNSGFYTSKSVFLGGQKHLFSN